MATTATRTKRDVIHRELERIASEHGGICPPAAVVEEASDPGSPLHEAFEWDNAAAAYQYRLWQARELILNVAVEYADPDTKEVRVFVSQTGDRNEGGGYRVLADVLDDKAQRAELVIQAAKEFRRFKTNFVRRYSRLAEFEPALRSMERLIRKYIPKDE